MPFRIVRLAVMSKFRLRVACVSVVLSCAGTLHAAASAEAAPTATVGGELLSILLPLALIILALFAVLHLLRRRFGLTRQNAPLTVLQILPVGPRERIVLVKARSGRVFAVGVANQSVTLITKLEPEDVADPVAAASSAVSQGLDTTAGR